MDEMMRSKEWIVAGVIVTVVAIVGAVIAVTAPPHPQPVPMTLPIPAGTIIRITNITNANGTLKNAPIATFIVTPPGGRLVGAYQMNGGGLMPWPSPWAPVIYCPLNGTPSGTGILNDTLDPGGYGLWVVCPPAIRNPPTPANPITVNVSETIQVVYG